MAMYPLVGRFYLNKSGLFFLFGNCRKTCAAVFLFLYCGYQILEKKRDMFASCLATENKMTIRLGLRLIFVF